MSEPNDPRVFFAAERTLLAWLRTGLAIIGLGFLVARFGLFLRMVSQGTGDVQPPLTSSIIGIGFVCLGSLMIGIAARQHHRFMGELQVDQRPVRYWIHFAVWSAAAVAIFGIALGGYLLWSVVKTL